MIPFYSIRFTLLGHVTKCLRFGAGWEPTYPVHPTDVSGNRFSIGYCLLVCLVGSVWLSAFLRSRMRSWVEDEVRRWGGGEKGGGEEDRDPPFLQVRCSHLTANLPSPGVAAA